jgi:hypothetical protein
VLRLLTVENCGLVLARSSGSGLVRLERASRDLALREFDDFARTAGFMGVGEEVLGSLLEDVWLWTEGEERVFEDVVLWMKGGEGGEVRGLGLLGKVRFPLMEEGYLAGLLREGCGELAGLRELVEEALGLKSLSRDEWGRQRLRHLDERALVGRRGGVRWEMYAGGGERRLAAGQHVCSVAADVGYVCGGLTDGSIRVWSRSTLELEQTLTGHKGTVQALLFVHGQLISGSRGRFIRVWDVATGRCKGVLEGHTGAVASLAVCGSRLLSGSEDETVRVWEMEGAASKWQCERTLGGHAFGVICMVAFGGRMACGCGDGGIRVWSTETWALERTLLGHDVCWMAVSGRRLMSSSMDGTVRAWSTETWECVQTVEVYPVGTRRHIRCLEVCGSTLVGGFCSESPPLPREDMLRVWDLETLCPLHTLVRPAGNYVRALLWNGRELWGAVGEQVVVWGWRG